MVNADVRSGLLDKFKGHVKLCSKAFDGTDVPPIANGPCAKPVTGSDYDDYHRFLDGLASFLCYDSDDCVALAVYDNCLYVTSNKCGDAPTVAYIGRVLFELKKVKDDTRKTVSDINMILTKMKIDSIEFQQLEKNYFIYVNHNIEDTYDSSINGIVPLLDEEQCLNNKDDEALKDLIKMGIDKLLISFVNACLNMKQAYDDIDKEDMKENTKLGSSQDFKDAREAIMKCVRIAIEIKEPNNWVRINSFFHYMNQGYGGDVRYVLMIKDALNEILDVFENVFLVGELLTNDKYKRIIDSQIKILNPDRLHAEMAIVDELRNLRIQDNVSVTIGISKSCCYMCWYVIYLLNEDSKFPRFKVRGSHFEFSEKWIPPKLIRDELESICVYLENLHMNAIKNIKTMRFRKRNKTRSLRSPKKSRERKTKTYEMISKEYKKTHQEEVFSKEYIDNLVKDWVDFAGTLTILYS